MKKPVRIGATRREEGYMLLSIMLVMALMLIALSAELPRISQQIQREKEEELVHRGREYAIAIKRFYHKTGTYPASIEQLESTNNLRFLRKRFKDPMTEKGEFKLVHVGEAQITVPTAAAGINNAQQGGATSNPGTTAGAGGLNSNTGAAGSSFGSGGLNSGSGGLSTGGLNSGGLNSGGTGGLSTGGLGTGGLGSGSQGSSTTTGAATGAAGTAQPATGQMGTLTTQSIGNGMGGQGGGQFIGVASTSKKTSIKSFNDASEYDEWLFVYDPRVEQAGGGGVVVAAPTGMGKTGSDGLPQPVQPVRAPQ